MKRSENILLLGLGGVGHYVAQRLSAGGHHVTVIEQDPGRLGRSDSEIDARFIKGDVLDVRCWRTAGAEEMDYVIAVTDDDAANIVAAQIAESFGIQQKIARIRASPNVSSAVRSSTSGPRTPRCRRPTCTSTWSSVQRSWRRRRSPGC